MLDESPKGKKFLTYIALISLILFIFTGSELILSPFLLIIFSAIMYWFVGKIADSIPPGF